MIKKLLFILLLFPSLCFAAMGGGLTRNKADNLYWSLATDQTLLTGDKSGSFDLTTTGTLGAGVSTLSSLRIPQIGGTAGKYSIFQGGANTADLTYTLPTAYPASIAFLKISNAGVMTTDTNTYLTAEADTLQSVMTRGATTATQLTSTYPTASGSPFAITSTTVNTNLNADLLDGSHSSAFLTSVTAHNLLSAIHGDTTASTVARGDLIVGTGASATWDNLALGTVGKILRSDGTDLKYTTSTFADTYAINTILYAGTANIITGLATGNSGVLVTGATGIPSIATDIPTAVTIGGKYIYRADGTDIPVADGGTYKSTWTQYCIPYLSTTTAFSEIAIGVAGKVLAVAAGATGYEWVAQPTIASLGLDADLATFSLPASTTISTFGASLIDDAAASNALSTLGLTATAAELNKLDGFTGIFTQLNYLNAATGTTGTTSTSLVFSTSPTLITPALGTPSALVGTNISGTAASLTAGKATILATARTIDGVSFDGSANIVLPQFKIFEVQQAKVAHFGVTAAKIEGGLNRWYLLFDPDTDWFADFQFIMPVPYVSTQTITVKLMWTNTVASNNVVWNAALMATTSGDAALLETDSFDTVNATTTAASATIGRPVTTSITMTTKDSVAAGDICTLRISRDANNASDTNTGVSQLAGIVLESN